MFIEVPRNEKADLLANFTLSDHQLGSEVKKKEDNSYNKSIMSFQQIKCEIFLYFRLSQRTCPVQFSRQIFNSRLDMTPQKKKKNLYRIGVVADGVCPLYLSGETMDFLHLTICTALL
ncbi:hypothetical protein TNCV_3738411 [Trichonephila clavipes]|nr:hypothetical protein TNCV_3738411 [Trichonephila clavipes]